MTVIRAIPYSETSAGRCVARALAELSPEKAAGLLNLNVTLRGAPLYWQIVAEHRNGETYFGSVPAVSTYTDAAAELVRLLP